MLQGNKLLSFKSDKSHEIYGQTKGLLQVSEDYGEITSKCNLGSWTLVEITTRHLEKLACLIYDNISVNNITNHCVHKILQEEFHVFFQVFFRFKNTGVGRCSLLLGFFPTQGLNPGLLHCRWILYH